MSISRKLPRRSTLFVALVASLALAGIASASASATTWVQGNTTMKWTAASTITLKKSGGSATTCTWPSSISGDPTKSPYVFGAQNNHPSLGTIGGVTNRGWFFSTKISCAGATSLAFCSCFEAGEETGAGVFSANLQDWFPGSGYTSPYGSYYQSLGSGEGVFTNGSEGTPSTLSFNEAVIGYTNPANQPITMTATFNVTDAKGGLLTLEG